MKVIITGATGMVGEGVLLECLKNPEVSEVLSVSRRHYDLSHPKLKELIVPDFTQLEDYTIQLTGYDACFFCAGISSVGMKEAEFERVTYNTTLAFARQLHKLNPELVFTYVSGTGTDSSEKGRLMWARVKGKTENDLIKLFGKNAYNFRPGIMKPTKGQKSIKPLYKILVPILLPFFPGKTLTLEQVGKAMINAAKAGYQKQVLEIKDIANLSRLK